MKQSKEAITIGEQVGGPDAALATSEAMLALRRLIREHCRGPYSTEVDEFALLFRIPGSVGQFGEWFVAGCSRVRRSRKDRYISVDIGVGREAWDNKPANHLRLYLAHVVKEALVLCIERLKRDKCSVDDGALMKDYARAVEEYLA